MSHTAIIIFDHYPIMFQFYLLSYNSASHFTLFHITRTHEAITLPTNAINSNHIVIVTSNFLFIHLQFMQEVVLQKSIVTCTCGHEIT